MFITLQDSAYFKSKDNGIIKKVKALFVISLKKVKVLFAVRLKKIKVK
jgi:hypothetical protein